MILLYLTISSHRSEHQCIFTLQSFIYYFLSSYFFVDEKIHVNISELDQL